MIRVCAACSIISVLTQWGATLVIKIREREREFSLFCAVVWCRCSRVRFSKGLWRGVGEERAIRRPHYPTVLPITRVAPHCVNTLMILHAAHTPMMSAG